MKLKILLVTTILPCLFVFGIYCLYPNSLSSIPEPSPNTVDSFYDGNGNVIPNSVIHLEVESHFAKMTDAELDSINHYFYADTLFHN